MDLNIEDDGQFREALKQALVEVIQEQPELFAEVLAEALESFVLAHGIHAADTPQVGVPAEVMKAMAQGA